MRAICCITTYAMQMHARDQKRLCQSDEAVAYGRAEISPVSFHALRVPYPTWKYVVPMTMAVAVAVAALDAQLS